MKKITRVLLLIVLVVVLGCAITGAFHSLGKAKSQANATQCSAKQPEQAGTRVQTVAFASKLVGKTLPYNVVLPVDYDKPSAANTRYPVLYLLHGLFGHYDNWTARTNLSD